MSTSPASPTPANTTMAPAAPDTRGLIRLLTAGAGISVACIYLNHPLLGLIGRDLAIAPHALGVLPTLTAAGYASGISPGIGPSHCPTDRGRTSWPARRLRP